MNKFNLKEMKLIENEIEVSENTILKSLFKSSKLKGLTNLTHTGLKKINPTLANDLLSIFKNRTTLGKLGTVDNLIGSLAKGTLNPTQLGDVLVGAMKTDGVSKELVRELTPIWVSDVNFIKSHLKDGKLISKESDLIRKGYSKEAAESISLHFKAAGASEKATAKLFKDAKGGTKNIKPKTNGSKVKPNQKTSLLNRSKELLKLINGKTPWLKIVGWAATFGVGVYALWWFIYEMSDTLPDGMPENEPNPNESDWGPCFTDILKFNQGRIVKTQKGSTVILVPSSEDYPGGLTFYSNNRLINNKTKEMGTWSCDGSKVKLEESINDVVSRVLRERLLNEQSGEVTPVEMEGYVDTVVDDLDGYVAHYNLVSIFNTLKKLKGRTYKGADAMTKFFDYYYTDEESTFIDDLNGVRVKDMGVQSQDLKNAILKFITNQKTPVTNTPKKPGLRFNTMEEQELTIKWDKEKKSSGDGKKSGDTPIKTGGETVKKKFKSQFHDCEGKDFPLEFGCKSTKIAEVQKCLGVTADGKFGRFTKKAMEDLTHDTSKGLTKDVYDNIINNCGNKRNDVETVLQSGGLKMSDLVKNNGGAKLDDTKLLNIIKNNQQPEELYKSLAAEGYIVGDVRSTTLEDGTIIPSTNRVKYKGPDLSEDLLGMLDSFISTMGYDRIKQKTKGYGEKYVWLKK